ncbi:MAG: hypothetical protein JO053_09745 [Acidobacteria bacterium]|nr:hypothetical protein [Acidobacteriota bacterium]
MKFYPGLLTDEEQEAVRRAAKLRRESLDAGSPHSDPKKPASVESPKPASPPPRASAPVVVEKDRLFETVEKEDTSSRNYLKLFAIVVAMILVAGGIIFYMALPKVGDKVKASKELEDAMRSHFLEKEKRTATDIDFYYCGSYHWARVGVETRTDIPGNPLAKIPTYAAKATPVGGGQFNITAAPITSPDQDKPCG